MGLSIWFKDPLNPLHFQTRDLTFMSREKEVCNIVCCSLKLIEKLLSDQNLNLWPVLHFPSSWQMVILVLASSSPPRYCLFFCNIATFTYIQQCWINTLPSRIEYRREEKVNHHDHEGLPNQEWPYPIVGLCSSCCIASVDLQPTQGLFLPPFPKHHPIPSLCHLTVTTDE